MSAWKATLSWCRNKLRFRYESRDLVIDLAIAIGTFATLITWLGCQAGLWSIAWLC